MERKILIFLFVLASFFNAWGQQKPPRKSFTESFDSCSFASTGKNNYFILEPGYQLVLEGMELNDSARLMITVLNETRTIGNMETRIVEEIKYINGKTAQSSKHFFAFCKQTSSIYFLGEEVDIYVNEKIVSHKGAWVAGGKNRAGIAMPGLPLLGSRYFRGIAPGVAMDRDEIISMEEKLQTPAGSFVSCLKVEQSTSLNAREKGYKLYAHGIGLIKCGNLTLVKYGYVK